MVSSEVHKKHLAAAMQNFYDCYGDEQRWDDDTRRLHDRMLARIDVQDGYEPRVDGRLIDLD